MPYILILSLFFCIVPWKLIQVISLEFWIVVGVTGLLVFQIIKDNDIIWGIIVLLFSIYCFWMVLAVLSDLRKPGVIKDDFILFSSMFLIAIFVVDIWLLFVKPTRVKKLAEILF